MISSEDLGLFVSDFYAHCVGCLVTCPFAFIEDCINAIKEERKNEV